MRIVLKIVSTILLWATFVFALMFPIAYAGIITCPVHNITYINLPNAACPSCETDDILQEDIHQAAAKWNATSLQFFQSQTKDVLENRGIASHSVQDMLSILVAGSELFTQKQLADAMGTEMGSFSGMLKLLQATHKNSRKLFHQYNLFTLNTGHEFARPYHAYLKYHHHDSGLHMIQSLDYSNWTTVEALTKDVSQKMYKMTQGEAFDSLTPESLSRERPSLMLFNMTFITPWWDVYEGENGDFTLHDGRIINTTLFTGSVRASHSEHEGWQSIILPQNDFEMLAILPPEGVLPSQMSAGLYHHLCDKVSDKKTIKLTVPEYQFTSEYDLREIFAQQIEQKKLPIYPFTSDANFSPIVESGSVQADKLTHRVFLKSDRHGSQEINMTGKRNAIDDDTPTITLNRPFIFVIRDKQYQAIRFISQVYSPKELQSYSGEELFKHRAQLFNR